MDVFVFRAIAARIMPGASALPPKRGRWMPVARACAIVLLAGSLGACSSFDFFSKKDDTPADAPADKLYNEGLYLLNAKKDPKQAVKKFEEVDRQHPYSEWARKSLIMTSYAYYQAGEYDDCVNSAKRYITLHPGGADAAYAQFLIGSSYFDEIPDVTRDQARTEKALAALDEVIRKYPGSEYSVSAKKKIEVARDQLAGKEMEIGRYYLKKKDYTGAINRFKVVVTKYQTTRHVEEALMRRPGEIYYRPGNLRKGIEETLNWFYDQREKTPLQLKATCAPHYYRILRQRAKEDGKTVTFESHGLDAVTRGCLGGTGFCFISIQALSSPADFCTLECGDVTKNSFEKIWNSSGVFLSLRNYDKLKGKCGICEFKRVCGGCRARAYEATGDYMAEEPLCSYEPVLGSRRGV